MRRFTVLFVLSTLASAQQQQPTLDDFWAGTAHFDHVRKFPAGDPAFPAIDAGTRVTAVNGTFFLFGRSDTPAQGSCNQGVIAVNVRASTDEGATWSQPHPIATPDLVKWCMFADGGAFFDTEANVWHYLVQSLAPAGKGGWSLSHFFTTGADPLGAWSADPANPVVVGGQLFNVICAGPGKHCLEGTVDEGTPQIVEKVGGEFVVTFHGYDYAAKSAVRGVASTPDFKTWHVAGGPASLPDDAIFSSLDCANWNISWAAGGCIGSGEASVLRSPSGLLYEVIEAADVALTCDLTPGEQWWPLGIVRSAAGWAPSPQWQQEAVTPLMVGPHVGCSLQYNSLWRDDRSGKTWWAVWNVDFKDGCQSWHMYSLAWGAAPMPMPWPAC